MCISALSSFNIGDQRSPIYIKDKDIHDNKCYSKHMVRNFK